MDIKNYQERNQFLEVYRNDKPLSPQGIQLVVKEEGAAIKEREHRREPKLEHRPHHGPHGVNIQSKKDYALLSSFLDLSSHMFFKETE